MTSSLSCLKNDHSQSSKHDSYVWRSENIEELETSNAKQKDYTLFIFQIFIGKVLKYDKAIFILLIRWNAQGQAFWIWLLWGKNFNSLPVGWLQTNFFLCFDCASHRKVCNTKIFVTKKSG